MTAGVTGVPAGRSSSPLLASSPRSRQSGTGRERPSMWPSASRWLSSIRMISSVPSGTIEPVAISIASPSPICGGTEPASACPVIRHGPVPRTAKPSTLEVGNAGRSVSVVSAAARVRPSARPNGTSIGSGRAARPAACAASRADVHAIACSDVTARPYRAAELSPAAPPHASATPPASPRPSVVAAV